jgi:hypothetical protein
MSIKWNGHVRYTGVEIINKLTPFISTEGRNWSARLAEIGDSRCPQMSAIRGVHVLAASKKCVHTMQVTITTW